MSAVHFESLELALTRMFADPGSTTSYWRDHCRVYPSLGDILL